MPPPAQEGGGLRAAGRGAGRSQCGTSALRFSFIVLHARVSAGAAGWAPGRRRDGGGGGKRGAAVALPVPRGSAAAEDARGPRPAEAAPRLRRCFGVGLVAANGSRPGSRAALTHSGRRAAPPVLPHSPRCRGRMSRSNCLCLQEAAPSEVSDRRLGKGLSGGYIPRCRSVWASLLWEEARSECLVGASRINPLFFLQCLMQQLKHLWEIRFFSLYT